MKAKKVDPVPDETSPEEVDQMLNEFRKQEAAVQTQTQT